MLPMPTTKGVQFKGCTNSSLNIRHIRDRSSTFASRAEGLLHQSMRCTRPPVQSPILRISHVSNHCVGALMFVILLKPETHFFVVTQTDFTVAVELTYSCFFQYDYKRRQCSSGKKDISLCNDRLWHNRMQTYYVHNRVSQQLEGILRTMFTCQSFLDRTSRLRFSTLTGTHVQPLGHKFGLFGVWWYISGSAVPTCPCLVGPMAASKILMQGLATSLNSKSSSAI